MKKHKLVLTGFLTILFLVSCKDSKKGLYDKNAIASIDKLSQTIGKLDACSYSLVTKITHKNSKEKTFELKESDVYLKGPNKMYIYTKKEGDGSKIAVFRFNEDTYETIKALNNTIVTITAIHDKYDVDFPAADFFYPTLTDDMIHDFDTIVTVGKVKVEGAVCTEINAKISKMNVFVSIDEATNLPKNLKYFI